MKDATSSPGPTCDSNDEVCVESFCYYIQLLCIYCVLYCTFFFLECLLIFKSKPMAEQSSCVPCGSLLLATSFPTGLAARFSLPCSDLAVATCEPLVGFVGRCGGRNPPSQAFEWESFRKANLLAINSDGLQPTSDGLQPTSNTMN